MFDSKGLIVKSRTDLDDNKTFFAQDVNPQTLEEAMVGCDVFIGLSKGNIVSKEMLKSMAEKPIVFALANPTPEIAYDDAVAARPDVIMATGRSDYPNQVNNVLGFPYIFRGALDVRATTINEAMKLAAVKALAELAKQPVPDIVNVAYNESQLYYGPSYIIPKPIDPRLLVTVSQAVAKAAMDSGVAKYPITDWDAYEAQLYKRLGADDNILRFIINKAKQNPQRVVFAEAENLKVLKAVQIVKDEGIAIPVLLGNERRIRKIIEDNKLPLNDVQIIDPKSEEMDTKCMEFGNVYFEKRQRSGFNLYEARQIMRERTYFGCMMVAQGEADAMISGLTRRYPDTVKPALEIIGMEDGVKRMAGMYIMLTKKGPLFFADTTLNFNPTVEQLKDITVLTANAVQNFNIKPRVAMLSYSNFGSSASPEARLARDVVEQIKSENHGWVIDGEIQAAVAFDKDLLKENYPFSEFVNEIAQCAHIS